MPCVPTPKPPIPSLPPGLTLAAPLPKPPQNTIPGACCILPTISTPPIPALLPPLTVNPAFIATLRSFLDQAEAWSLSLPLECPRS